MCGQSRSELRDTSWLGVNVTNTLILSIFMFITDDSLRGFGRFLAPLVYIRRD